MGAEDRCGAILSLSNLSVHDPRHLSSSTFFATPDVLKLHGHLALRGGLYGHSLTT